MNSSPDPDTDTDTDTDTGIGGDWQQASRLLRHSDEASYWPASTQLDLRAAYQRQLEVRALRIARGERPRGFKIGFTNRGIWSRYQVFAPIWATVYDSTLRFCEGEGSLDLTGTVEPRIEPEAVVCMRSTPPEALSLQGLFDSLEWVAAGIEIVQSHRPGWRFTSASDPVVDQGLHARLLVGRRIPVRELASDGAALDQLLAGARVELVKNGRSVERGLGSAVLDGPLHALLHFIRELRSCPGAPGLQVGDVVTTGTWTDAWPVAAGEFWEARFCAPLAPLALRLHRA